MPASCTDCKAYVYDKNTGTRATDQQGKYIKRKKPVRCSNCEKIRFGLEDWTLQSAKTWELYNQVQAGRPIELKPIFWEMFGILRESEKDIERTKGAQDTAELMARFLRG